MPERALAIANHHPRLRIDRVGLRLAIAVLDKAAAQFCGGCPPGELSIVFLTDEAQTRLHGDFMADPTPTDVITFEGAPSAGLAGEICVSADTAASYASAHHRDFAEELTLYVVHGWLHLAGYDDLQSAKKRRMRTAEHRAMSLLETNKALPAFSFRPSKKIKS